MNKKQIEKALKKEGDMIVPDVLDNVFASLGIEKPLVADKKIRHPFKDFFTSKGFLTSSSLACACALIIGVSIGLTPKTQGFQNITYVGLQITAAADEQGNLPAATIEGTPSFTYNVSKKGKATGFTPINDPAKIVAQGLQINDSYTPESLSKTIINESTATGFINLSGKGNVVRLTVSGIDKNARSVVLNKTKNEILQYFKDNYIYGVVEAVEIEDENSEIKDESKYAAIYKIYELTNDLFGTIYETDEDSASSYQSLDSWQNTLKDMSIEKLNTAVERLETIGNQFAKYDYLKKRFSNDLARSYEKYSNSYDYTRLDDKQGYNATLTKLNDIIVRYEASIADPANDMPLIAAKEKLANYELVMTSTSKKYSFYDWLFFDDLTFQDVSEDDIYDDDYDFSDDYNEPDDWENWEGWDDFDDDWWEDEDWDDYDDDWYYGDYYYSYHRLERGPNGPNGGPGDEATIENINRYVKIIGKQAEHIAGIQKHYKKNIIRILATVEYSYGAGYEYNYGDKHDDYSNNYNDDRDDDWRDSYDYDSWYEDYNNGHRH